MNLAELLRTVWRRKLIVVVVTALVLGGAAFFLAGQDKVYEARATIAIFPDRNAPELVPFYGQAVENLLPTYAQLIESETFLDRAAARLPFASSGAALKGAVFADPAARTGVLRIVAQTGDPEQSAGMAQATAEEFLAQLDDNGIVSLRLIDQARAPEGPISPRPKLVIAAGLIVGLGLGLGAALGWDRLFARVHTSAELAEATQLPVLGVVPAKRALKDRRRIVVGDADLFEIEECLRAIRTNVLFSTTGGNEGPILITGLNPGDGKSTIAANLAVIIGELGFSVLLVDADVHRPVQHEIFGVRNDRGLSSLVTGKVTPESLPQATAYPHVKLVPSGPPVATRSEELNVYLKHLPQLAGLADIVLIDSPPLRAADEVRILAAFSGAVVVLVRAGSVSRGAVTGAMESLQVLETPVLGTVLTMADDRDAALPAEYYRYRYRDGPGGETAG